jgi:hypothetical protein
MSSFVNVSTSQLCLPITSEPPDPSAEIVADGAYFIATPFVLQLIPANTEPVEGYPAELFRVVDVVRAGNITECGNQMCIDGDTCIHRYRNMTQSFVYKSPASGCATAKMMDQLAWDAGCYYKNYTHIEESYPVGCCPNNTTPCGSHDYTFYEYEVNSHSSPFIYDTMLGCANENETCCYPQICHAGSKCCTAKRTIEGNITLLQEQYINMTWISAEEGHNMCCPEDAYCCEFIPINASPLVGRPTLQSVPFCGLDENCLYNYFGNQRRKLPADRVQLTTPTTTTYFEEDLVWRTDKGVKGNFDPLGADQPDSNICEYQVYDPSSMTYGYFNITCEVINNGGAYSSNVAGGRRLAPFVGPGIQYIEELRIGGPVTCPSPTPEIWCVQP